MYVLTLLVIYLSAITNLDLVIGAEGQELPVGVAEPINLEALASLHGIPGSSPLLTGNGGGGGGAGFSGSANQCDSPDALTQLLVYKYLSGTLPGGTQAGPSSNLPLQALLASSVEPVTTTGTFVSTSLTTLVVTSNASTIYSTSTTSYVTTVTTVQSTIIPVLFRGKEIKTTVIDSSTDVITATEYETFSSITTPSIIQTLPVHITYTSTRTKGFNGQFTLIDVTPGASKVIHEPIATATVNLDVAGVDLSNLDLTQLDLTSLLPSVGSRDTQTLDAIASLLQQYSDEPQTSPKASLNSKFQGLKSFSKSSSSRFRENNFDRFRSNNRFSDPDYDESLIPDEFDAPKFDVLGGFTLSDNVPKKIPSGTAATSTRYSKFHKKKSKVVNNGLSTDNKQGPETEIFSASNHRTAKQPASSRFQRAQETNYYESSRNNRFSGKRANRQTSRSSRLRSNTPNKPSRRRTSRQKSLSTPVPAGRFTVLTMFRSGTVPGQYITTHKTVQLKSLQSPRVKRDVISPTQNFVQTSSAELLNSPDVKEILKKLDKKYVKGMVKNMHKWIDYYMDEVLEDSKVDLNNNEFDLSSSILNHELTVNSEIATASLVTYPSDISHTPSPTSIHHSLCPVPQTFTETVYRTIYRPSS